MSKAAGLTMIEVLIGATLVALISLGMLTAVLFYAQNSARSSAKRDADELTRLLQLTMANEDQCTVALRRLRIFTGIDVVMDEVFASGNPDALVQANGRYRLDSHLWINQIKVVNAMPGITPIPVQVTLEDPPNGRVTKSLVPYSANLIIEAAEFKPEFLTDTAARGKAAQLGAIVLPMKVYVENDGTGTVYKCQLATTNNQTCQSLGGTWDHSTGKCEFPVCDENMAVNPVWGGGACPAATGSISCSAPIYHWGHIKYNASMVTRLACICSTTCAAPTPSPAPSY